ncbi:MAG: BLUF domain-containing protein [Hyphomicrobiales bacterium]
MYLSRLIYYSRIILDSADRGAFKEIKKILGETAQHNEEAGITGGLLFNQTYFAQAIEGDRKAVTETFTSMMSDSRHQDVVILEARPIEKRRFLTWNMGFAGKTEFAKQLYVKYGASEAFDPGKMTADSLLGFIEEIITEEDALGKMFGVTTKTQGKTPAYAST